MDDTEKFLEVFRDVLTLRRVWDECGSSVGGTHPLEVYVLSAYDMFRLLYGHNYKGMSYEEVRKMLFETMDASRRAIQKQMQEEQSVLKESVPFEPKKRRSWLSWLWP